MEEKICIIHNDGSYEYIGNVNEDLLHSVCLLNYAKKNYSNVNIFNQLNFKHSPEVISYFLLHFFGDAVFLNTTKNVEKHGYTGMLLLPDKTTSNQKEALFDFLNKIDNYKVVIDYSLTLENGFLDGKELMVHDDKKPSDLLDMYYEKNSTKSK